MVENRRHQEVGQMVHHRLLVEEALVPPGPPVEVHFKGAKVSDFSLLKHFYDFMIFFKARQVQGHLELSLQPPQPRRLAAIASREINEEVF